MRFPYLLNDRFTTLLLPITNKNQRSSLTYIIVECFHSYLNVCLIVYLFYALF